MKSRPIIFNAEMVCALLEGRKTQTRRVIKPQPSVVDEDGAWQGCNPRSLMSCPYGLKDDKLWVRETFAYGTQPKQIFYKADRLPGHANTLKWKPSIHMLRWAFRLTLRIKDIRVERVQNIKVQDCIAEGIKPPDKYFDSCIARNDWIRMDFEKLWDSINAKRGYPWVSNPWVWVIDFEVIR